MRARAAIHYSKIAVELREIELRNKPTAMLACSPKGTVPVLVLPDGQVIDESLNIMLWALSIHDPESRGCINTNEMREQALDLIAENDYFFKGRLDRYKYWNRHPEFSMEHYRELAEQFLIKLEHGLQDHPFLIGHHETLADMAIAPFIRQFALVDKAWFDRAPYPGLRRWLETWMATPAHQHVMKKQLVWNGARSNTESR